MKLILPFLLNLTNPLIAMNILITLASSRKAIFRRIFLAKGSFVV